MCTHRVDQGSVAAAMAVDCCGVGGTVGSGLGSLGHMVESRARVQWGQGTTLMRLTARALSREPGLGCWWRRAQRRGGSGMDGGHGRAQSRSLEGCEGVE